MEPARRRLAAPSAALAVAMLVIAGCDSGDDSGADAPDEVTETTPAPASTDDPTASDATPPTTGGSSTVGDSMPASDLCEMLAQDEAPARLPELVPPEFSAAAQTLLDITSSFGLDEFSTPTDMIERLASPETGPELAALADEAERLCGPNESVDGIRFYAQISEFAQPAAPPGYCAELATLVAAEASDDEVDDALATAIDIAPVQHRPALEEIQAALRAFRETAPLDTDATSTFAALGGVGSYAEARCGVADSFAAMLFAGPFLLAGEALSPTPADGLGTVPPPADATAANALVPVGTELTFEVTEIDIDDDGDYLVSAVVPSGWPRDGSFDTTFEPEAGFGIFTEMSIDAGCDGLCEPTDWETRLTAPDGYIGLRRDSQDLFVDRPTDDTAGIVMAWAGFADGIEGAVIRWADATDRYFVCEFQLGEEDVALADAFVAACQAARPGWILGA